MAIVSGKGCVFWCRVNTGKCLCPHTVGTHTPAYLNLHTLCLEIQPHLQLEVINDWCEYLHPVLLEWGKPVGGYRDTPELRLAPLQG